MKLAFWKNKRSRRAAQGSTGGELEPTFDSQDVETDEAAALLLRIRLRRRLIGACALLLAVVVLVPMVLDANPRPVPDNIPIDLPSDKSPFTPKLGLPAPSPEASVAAPAATSLPAAPGSAADAATDAAPTAAADTSAGGSGNATGASAANAGADAKSKESTEPAKKHAARIYVQAAALASQTAAQELANRLSKSGLSPFVERADTSDGVRYRVRIGPFATRSEAEHSRARLKALGVNSNIVGLS